MAITAKFIADFTSFESAVHKTETQLKSFESGASKVQSALTRMTDNFSGRKLISEATLMTSAIERTGGVSKLTASELQQVGNKAAEAAEKMKKLGIDVPPGLQKIADAAKEASQATGGWLPLLQQLGSSWVARIAEGLLLRDAIVGIVGKIKEMAGALPDLVLKGAAIADVEENFKHLTTQVGLLGAALLGELKAGTHNTVTEFELMKTVNQDLAAGMVLTDKQFGALAKGAFALAQATGGDVKTALDTMNDAMLTGKTRALALLTGKIDLEKAETQYAASLGKSRANLTEAGKLEAARVAILDAVSAATGRLGAQTDGLDERVAQAQTAWTNFTEKLGSTIATSSHVMDAIDAIGVAIQKAFGGNTQAVIDGIVGWVNKFADLVGRYGPMIIQKIVDITKSIGEIYDQVQRAWSLVPDWFKNIARDAAIAGTSVYVLGQAFGVLGGHDLLTTGAALSNLGFGLVALTKAAWAFIPAKIALVAGLYETAVASGTFAGSMLGMLSPFAAVAIPIAALTAVLYDGKLAWDLWNQSAQATKDNIQNTATDMRMLAEASKVAGRPISDVALGLSILRDHAKDLRGEMKNTVSAHEDAGAAAKKHGDQLTQLSEKQKAALEKFQEAVTEVNAAGQGWRGTIDTINGAYVENMRVLTAAGVPLNQLLIYYGLTETQGRAFTDMLAAEKAALKSVDDAMKDAATSTRKWFEETAKATDEYVKTHIKAFIDAKTFAEKAYDEMARAGVSGKMREIKAIEQKEQAEIDSLSYLRRLYPQIYDELVGVVRQKYGQMKAEAIGASKDIIDVAHELGLKTKEDLAGNLELARNNYEALKTSGVLSVGELRKAWLKLKDAEDAARGGLSEWELNIDKLGDAFVKLAQISGDSFGGIVKDIAQVVSAMAIGTQSAKTFKEALGKNSEKTDWGNVAVGVVGMVGAMDQATKSTNRWSATFGGAATGAAIGGKIFPVIGTWIGGLAGALVGFIRSAGAAERAINPVREAFVQAAGGLDALNKRAHAAGLTLDHLLNAKNPQQYQAAIDELNHAFDTMATHLAAVKGGIEKAAGGTNALAGSLLNPLKDLQAEFDKAVQAGGKSQTSLGKLLIKDPGKKDAAAAQFGLSLADQIYDAFRKATGDETATQELSKKIAKAVADVQPAFEHLGQYVAATFAAQVHEGASAFEAFSALAPSFEALRTGVEDFGLKSTNTIDQLLKIEGVVGVNKDIGDSISALTQIYDGLTEAGYITKDLFESFGKDLAHDFDVLVSRGADGTTALQLMQPQLQKLWEGQQKFGEITDESTAKLLKQAEEQGLVGEDMKDVNDRILDVLIAIADVFGAKLPQSLHVMVSETAKAQKEAQAELNKIHAPDLRVGVHFDVDDLNLPDVSEPIRMAKGGSGTVTKPTLFLAGEAGREDYAFSGAGKQFNDNSQTSGGDVTFNVTMNNVNDPRTLTEEFRKLVRQNYRGIRTDLTESTA